MRREPRPGFALRIAVYRNALAAFLRVYRNALAAFLRVYRNALAAFLRVYRNALAAFLRVYRNALAAFLRVYRNALAASLRVVYRNAFLRVAYRNTLAAFLACACVAISSTHGEAHKPITSPYTFNEDVFPIVKEHCGSCHFAGGVAPMSLMTHADAVPWGESIRAELMAGHMPPWRIESAPGRFRNVQGLSARELNVLLTWASGGTPPGDPDKAPGAAASARQWPLGAPDVEWRLPEEVTVPSSVQEQVSEFVVPTGLGAARWIRAVDVLPGTPAIVRSATVSVGMPAAAASNGRTVERLVALWLPGDHPVPLDAGAAFELPAGANLIVRVRYRKTWEYENRAVSDRSTIGLYFTEGPVTAVEALVLAGEAKAGQTAATVSSTMPEPMRLVAIYPDPDFVNAAVDVVAVRPDGSRDELIAFRPQAGWARRYWFREPIALSRGTRIEARVRLGEALLPPNALAARPQAEPGRVRLTLNVLRGT